MNITFCDNCGKIIEYDESPAIRFYGIESRAYTNELEITLCNNCYNYHKTIFKNRIDEIKNVINKENFINKESVV